MAEYTVIVEFHGVVGLAHHAEKSGLWALCSNMTEPTRLRLPHFARKSIFPHFPLLFFEDDAEITGSLPVIQNALTCDSHKKRWQAICLHKLNVELVTDSSEPPNFNLEDHVSIQTVLKDVSTSPTNKTPQRQLLTDKYGQGKAERYPSVSTRFLLTQGSLQPPNPAKQYKCLFSYTHNVHVLSKVIQVKIPSVTNPVILKYRPLQTELDCCPQTQEVEIKPDGSKNELLIRLDNNPIKKFEGDRCRDTLDFVAHYNILTTPPALLKFPYPDRILKEGGDDGGASDAQCSPAVHETGG